MREELPLGATGRLLLRSSEWQIPDADSTVTERSRASGQKLMLDCRQYDGIFRGVKPVIADVDRVVSGNSQKARHLGRERVVD